MAAADYLLKIDGIEGESSDSKHKGEIEIESWNFTARQLGTHGDGGGGGAGKVVMEDFHFAMKMNRASPKLLLACATGEHVKKAVLTLRKAGKDQQEYAKIIMSDLLVSSYSTGGGAGGDIVPSDQITLNYAKLEVEYKEQKPDGTLAGPIKAGWDLKLGAKV